MSACHAAPLLWGRQGKSWAMPGLEGGQHPGICPETGTGPVKHWMVIAVEILAEIAFWLQHMCQECH